MMLTSKRPSRLGRRSAPLWALLGVLGALAIAPGAASAANNQFTCSAQALRASGLLNLSTTAANGGGDPCTTQSSGVNVSLAPLITAGVANANTTSVAGTSGMGEADVALTSGLVTSSVLRSTATASCSTGNPVFNSTSNAASVTVGGVVFNASGSANVNLLGLGLASVTVTLNPSPTITGSGITQDAAHINISIAPVIVAGITIAPGITEDIVLGEASAGADGNPCATTGGGGTGGGGGGTGGGTGGGGTGGGGNGGGTTSPPHNVSPPQISGNPLPGNRLSCSTGSWTGGPTRYTYQWKLAGRVISGANGSTYVVTIGDEASSPSDALTCVVTAYNGAGASAPATSRGVLVAVKGTLRCARPTGHLSGSVLGVLGLGLGQKTARLRLPRYQITHNRFDNFCLYAGWGIRVAYPSPALMKAAHAGALRGRIVIALTANPFYALDGTRPGTKLTAGLGKRLRVGKPFHIGRNYWYIVPGSGSRGLLKVRGGVIQEVGIVSRQLSNGHSAQGRVLHSFPNVF